MTKKKDKADSNIPGPEEPEAVPNVSTEAGAVEDPKGYRLSTWAGKTIYACLRCAFDSFDETTIKEHVQSHFNPPAENGKPNPADVPEGSQSLGVYEVILKEVDDAKDDSH